MADTLPRCLYVYEACYRYPDKDLCKATDQVCGTIKELFHNESHAGGRDPFDSKPPCRLDAIAPDYFDQLLGPVR